MMEKVNYWLLTLGNSRKDGLGNEKKYGHDSI
jgi:hypothetical protein